MFSFNPLAYLLAAVAASPVPPSLPVLPFETALAPILDIAACDGMADRIRGFEPLPAGGKLFLAIQAAPGQSGQTSSEYEAPVSGSWTSCLQMRAAVSGLKAGVLFHCCLLGVRLTFIFCFEKGWKSTSYLTHSSSA